MKVPSTTVRKYYKYVLEPFYIDSLPTYANATEATEGKNSNAGSCLISFSPTAVYPCIAKSQNTRITNSYNYEIIFTFEHSFIFKTASHSGWVISDQLPSSGLKAIAGSNDQTTWTTLSNNGSNETAYKYIRITLTGSETHIYGQMGISYLNMAGYIYCSVPEECSEEEADFYIDTKSPRVPRINNNFYVVNDYVSYKGRTPFIVVPVSMEWKTAGTYSFTLTEEKEVTIALIGGGGGGSTISNNTIAAGGGGGSGAGFIGTITLTAGIYTVNVGGGGWNNHGYSAGITAGAGGATTLVNNNTNTTIISAGGGAGGTCGDLVYSYGWGGVGGTIDTSNATIISSTLNSNGNNGPVSSDSTTYPNIVYAQSLYNGYGQGGACGAGSGSGSGSVGFASVAWLNIITG